MKTAATVVFTILGLGILALIGLTMVRSGIGLREAGIAGIVAVLQIGASFSGFLIDKAKGRKG